MRHGRAFARGIVPDCHTDGYEHGANLLGKSYRGACLLRAGPHPRRTVCAHWHDLAAIARSPYFASIVADHAVAAAVAQHKSCFFIEKDTEGAVIDYTAATHGHLRIVPEGDAREALAEDYAAMLADEVMIGDALSFDQLMQACAEVAAQVNKSTVS